MLHVFFLKGASLASIEDPSEQEFIKSHTSVYQDIHSSFWIGLYKNIRGTVTFSDLLWKEALSYRDRKDWKKNQNSLCEQLMKKIETFTGHSITKKQQCLKLCINRSNFNGTASVNVHYQCCSFIKACWWNWTSLLFYSAIEKTS